MIFQRINASELSVRRLLGAVRRRALDLPDRAAWQFSEQSRSYNQRNLARFANIHTGERCFIIGNGPSLNRMDLEPLRNEITIGLNRIYLLFEAIPFQPSYYVCVNELVLEQYFNEITALEMPKFVNWNYRRLFPARDPNTLFIRMGLGINDYFSKDPLRELCAGGTVTYAAMQLAYYMGFGEVILIGIDHNFQDKGVPNTTEIRQAENDLNHFHPNYFPKGSRWQLPDLKRSEMAYALARQAFEQAGRRVIDATQDGKCPVFQKAAFTSLFPESDAHGAGG